MDGNLEGSVKQFLWKKVLESDDKDFFKVTGWPLKKFGNEFMIDESSLMRYYSFLLERRETYRNVKG